MLIYLSICTAAIILIVGANLKEHPSCRKGGE